MTTFFQMIASLGLVVLLIFVFGTVYKKRFKGSDLISLLAYQSFGQKMGIAALKIGKEIIILGFTPSQFKVIKRLDEKEFEASNATGASSRIERLKMIKEDILK